MPEAADTASIKSLADHWHEDRYRALIAHNLPHAFHSVMRAAHIECGDATKRAIRDTLAYIDDGYPPEVSKLADSLDREA